jgi:hypothetical protein
MSGNPPSICSHLIPGPYPFETVLVLDDHLGPTDWLVRCRACPTTYLLEMLDWDGPRRLYRLRAPAAAAVAGLVRDLERGSCDLSRAAAEAQHFTLSSQSLPTLALLDLRASTLVATIEVPRGTHIPSASWRELPCDSSWIRRLSACG